MRRMRIAIIGIAMLAAGGMGLRNLFTHHPGVVIGAVRKFLPTVPNAMPAPFLPIRPVMLARTTVVVPPSLAKAAKGVVGKMLTVPEGWTMSVYAAGFDKPRMFARDASGTIYLTAMNEGAVYALTDANQDGVADPPRIIARDLSHPSGIAWHDGWLYVAEEDRVRRFEVGGGAAGDLATLPPGGFRPSERQTLIGSLRDAGRHVTRTIAIRGDTLYVSVGSSCDACEDEEHRAVVLAYGLDGSGERVYARGLRNAVGLIVGPDGDLWATDNGRDRLGDDIPPEEVDVVEEGGDYGWPYCYGDRVSDPEFGSPERCATTEPPEIAFQAHSAPLGLRFLGGAWPEEVSGDLLVASHGSWDRDTPVGYAIYRFSRKTGAWEASEFVTGWRPGEEDAWGRPVDMIEGGPGELYISDDKAGVVYLLKAPS